MATIGGYNVVTDGLVLSLDAANRRSYVSGSGTWFDVSGNGNSGSLVNGPGFDSGSGGSLVFDGVDDYVDCGSSKISSGAFTFSSWVKINQVTISQVILAQGSNADGSYQYLAFRNYLFQFSSDGSQTFASSNETPTTNVWYNVVGVYNPSIINKNVIYINSFLQSTISTSNATFLANNTSIGRSLFLGGSSYFFGNISNIQIYNRALSAAEVLQNYNATKGRFGL